jgi:hypothetical protein
MPSRLPTTNTGRTGSQATPRKPRNQERAGARQPGDGPPEALTRETSSGKQQPKAARASHSRLGQGAGPECFTAMVISQVLPAVSERPQSLRDRVHAETSWWFVAKRLSSQRHGQLRLPLRSAHEERHSCHRWGGPIWRSSTLHLEGGIRAGWMGGEINGEDRALTGFAVDLQGSLGFLSNRWTMLRQTGALTARVRGEYGSKMRGITSGAIPGPLSWTDKASAARYCAGRPR